MPQGIYKRKSPVQEKLAKIKEIILKDALNREKSIIELAKIYGVHPLSLLKFYKENGIKKKRKYIKYGSRYSKGCCEKRIEELRSYIKENNIPKEQIMMAVLSMFK